MLVMLASADAGTTLPASAEVSSDAPRVELIDAGVAEVRSAITYSGQALGDGWWLSRERIKRVEARTREVQAAPSSGSAPAAFLVGIGLGFVGGIAFTIWAGGALR